MADEFGQDEILGRAAYRLCETETPGGRKLVDALIGGRWAHKDEDDSIPPWKWAQAMVWAAIEELRKAGWTVEPPSSLSETDPDA